jgi:hypothetical protein
MNGSFNINTMEENLVDDPLTDVNEALPECHGIMILTTPEGDAGEFVINATAANAIINGTSGKVHTFVPYSGITGTTAGYVFCSDRDALDNICKHGTTGGARVWVKQSTTGGG